jgi:hypothetical protein
MSVIYEGHYTGLGTSHAIPVAASGNPTAGHRITLIVGANIDFSTITWPSGFSEIGRNNPGTTDPIFLAEKTAVGDEGTTVTVETGASIRVAAQSYVMDEQDTDTAVEVAFAHEIVTADDQPDPPSISHSWGSEAGTTIIAAANQSVGSNISFTAYPASYTDGSEDSVAAGGGGTSIGTARRVIEATSEDPGVFTMDGADFWNTATIALRGAAVGGGDPEGPLVGDGKLVGGGLLLSGRLVA